jgi:hypothetical protein
MGNKPPLETVFPSRASIGAGRNGLLHPVARDDPVSIPDPVMQIKVTNLRKVLWP